jgi:hypothetical protein
MTLFLGRPLDSGKWQEWEVQSFCVQELRRKGYFLEGDQNAAKRGWGAIARAKAAGMQAGSPDLRIFLPDARLVLIELKRIKGRLSDSQNTWHAEAAKRGFTVHMVYADYPKAALEQIERILNANI